MSNLLVVNNITNYHQMEPIDGTYPEHKISGSKIIVSSIAMTIKKIYFWTAKAHKIANKVHIEDWLTC